MISGEQFRQAMSRFASGVTVITTMDASGRHHGITVSAFCSVSADPPLVLVCIHKLTACHYAFLEYDGFVVNILGEDQQHVSRQFALAAENKFGGDPILTEGRGLPRLDGSLVTLECATRHTYDGGDHTIIVGEVEHADIRDGRPLIYFHHDYRTIKE
jgi:flavin reductase ActVB